MRQDRKGRLGMWTGPLWVAVVLLGSQVVPAHPEIAPGCTCAPARETSGWCGEHERGWVASVELRSYRLWETVDTHGHELDLTSFTCPGCREAIATSGFCTTDRIGFVEGRAYFSRLGYELARGTRTDPARLDCPVCREHAAGHGWCERCGAGMVGPVRIADRTAYDAAARDLEVLRQAAEMVPTCEGCAVAMITDTECPRCRVTYRDGRPARPD